ncbi:hypothetical protein [Leptolyngbya sp. FACHB-261]|uniref:hypothetical protein n=1 Tax=Leptolyngbya sp. FACHB-261 TaxID=2692806 RepID=UPI0016861390|nr:hypothetical protein [Leptolyngbya sp. FACHB-261]MBD2100951.1 hypothetical protein [Leptolyngbya sp. FACHB-261]
MSAIRSGEVYAPSDRTDLPAPAHFAMLHIRPTWLHTIAAEMAEKFVSLPFFSTAFLTDAKLNRLFLALQVAVDQKNSNLEHDEALWDFLSYPIRRYASNSPSVRFLKSSYAAVRLACDYLHAYYGSDIS